MSNTSRSIVNNAGQSRSWLEKVRRFIDGENDDHFDAEVQPETPPRQRARDLFYKHLARQIDELLNQEAFGPPNVPLTVPPEIVVFVAPDINANWLNQVRRRLLDGLDATIKQRVKDMAGAMPNRTLPPRITLEEDTSLDTGDVRLEARWGQQALGSDQVDSEATVVHLDPTQDEATIVLAQGEPLYSLDIFSSGNYEKRMTVSKRRTTIGRSGKTKSADISLSGVDVSRTHAVLDYEQSGLWLTALGQNGTRVGGQPLARRHRRRLHIGETIEIGGFTLQLAELRIGELLN